MLCTCPIQMAMADLEKQNLKNIVLENIFSQEQKIEKIMTTERIVLAQIMRDARAIRLKTSYSFRF